MTLNGHPSARLPNTLNVNFVVGVGAEIPARMPGVAASTRSAKTACSRWHPLPDPKLHTAREWPPVVERMPAYMREMGERAVTNAEKDEIAAYLSWNARK